MLRRSFCTLPLQVLQSRNIRDPGIALEGFRHCRFLPLLRSAARRAKRMPLGGINPRVRAAYFVSIIRTIAEDLFSAHLCHYQPCNAAITGSNSWREDVLELACKAIRRSFRLELRLQNPLHVGLLFDGNKN